MRKHTLARLAILARICAASLLAFVPAALAAEADKPAIGFEALTGFDQLSLLADWPAYQDSSYSRQNLNQDAGNFLRVEPNGDQVLTDTDGPGVIYRFWSTGVVGVQMSKECRLRFYFDHEATPRLDVSISELFGSKGSQWPFVPPLSVTFESGRGGGEGPCNLCYVPIPFAEHIKIVGRKVMFYHVDYHKLPRGTPLESFSVELAQKHRAVFDAAAAQWEQVGQRPVSARAQEFQQLAAFTLAPGESRQLRFQGEGMLGTLAGKLAQPTPKLLRGVVLEIAFEDEANLCVLAPIGDFFGSGCGDRRFKSLPCGMTEEGYYAYWPMPFRKLAVVTLRNECPQAAQIESCKVGAFLGPQPAGAAYFHARYVENPDVPIVDENRPGSPGGEDYHILNVTGRGKFVGTNVSMQNTRGATGIFFLEGDEKIYVDGEKWPSRWLGTGTEDYFNGAYFWNAPDKAALARPLGGLTFLDWGIGRVCAYRWHLLDFVSFQKSIRVDLEHGGVSECPAHYASVAYYYLDKPTCQAPLPALAQRLPKTPLPPAPKYLCCEPAAPPEIQGKPLTPRGISELDPEYESDAKLLYGRGRVGDQVQAPLKVPGEDEFKLVLLLSGGPDHAALSVSLDDKVLGQVEASRPAFTPWFATEMGPVRLGGGEHRLALKLVKPAEGTAAKPAEEGATDLAVGLVAVQLRPSSLRINQWSVIGNWPCPKDTGWQQPHEPEKNQDLSAVYRLPQGGEARWREVKSQHVGLGGGDWLVAYGLTYIFSPDDRAVALFIAKDDGLKVWVNDEVVFDLNAWSHATPDQFFCTAKLKKGWNKTLVKCANWSGGWGFALRPGDPDMKLRFARSPE